MRVLRLSYRPEISPGKRKIPFARHSNNLGACVIEGGGERRKLDDRINRRTSIGVKFRLQLWKYSNSDAFRLIIERSRSLFTVAGYRLYLIIATGESRWAEKVSLSMDRLGWGGREGGFTLYEVRWFFGEYIYIYITRNNTCRDRDKFKLLFHENEFFLSFVTRLSRAGQTRC